MSMRPYAFGVDIGGTAIKMGLFRTEGILLEKWQIPTRTEFRGEFVLTDVLSAVRGRMEKYHINWNEVEGIGMGVPGPVKNDGTVLGCINLGWGEFNLPQKMGELEPGIRKFRVANDVNAATLGEIWKGSASDYDSAVMITLGTGIGGGAVIDQKMVMGSSGAAGEIGHFRVNREETEPCKCGGYGCLEQYCSATGLVRMAKRKLAQFPLRETVIRDKANLSAKEICDAAKERDAFCVELLDDLGDRLGWALTSVACTVNPEIFIIGGGLSRAGNILLKPIQSTFRKYAFHTLRDTEFALAALGNDAGIYGCVRMVLQ